MRRLLYFAGFSLLVGCSQASSPIEKDIAAILGTNPEKVMCERVRGDLACSTLGAISQIAALSEGKVYSISYSGRDIKYEITSTVKISLEEANSHGFINKRCELKLEPSLPIYLLQLKIFDFYSSGLQQGRQACIKVSAPKGVSSPW